jgi:hypothetical protein
MKTKTKNPPLVRTSLELASVIDSIRGDCSTLTADLLTLDAMPEVNDLAELDEALNRAGESIALTCATLLLRQRQRKATPHEAGDQATGE